MKEIRRITQVREGRNWKDTHTDRDVASVYEWLASDLINRYIHKAPYIRRIGRISNYDGTQNITVTYDNGYRNVYTVKN